MATDVGVKFGVSGEAEFKSAITGVNSQIKNLQSEMKLAVSEMAGMSSEEEKNAKQLDILQRTYEATGQKVELLTGKYNDAKERLAELGRQLEDTKNKEGASAEEIVKAEDAYNRQAKAVNDLGTQLNNAQASMNNTKTQMDNLKNGTDETASAMDNAGKSALTFGDILSSQVVSEAIISGVKKLAEGIKEVAFGSSQYADEILTLSQTTSISTDALQEYQYMAELVDVSLDTITGSLTKLTKNMYAAQDGTGSAAEAFKKLGVEVTDSEGNLRNNQEVFNELIDKLAEVENQTEADALSMQVFGKSANQLKPIIAAGSEQLAAYAEEAHAVGYVMDETALAVNGAADDAFQRFSNQIEAVKNQLGTAFAPALEQVLTTLTTVAQNIDDATVIGDAVNSLFTKVLNTVMEKAPDVINAAVSSIAAFVQGLSQSLPTLIPKAAEMVTTLVGGLIQNIPQLISAAFELLKGLAEGLLASLPVVFEAAGKVVAKIVEPIVNGVSGLIERAKNWGKDLIDNFIAGIKAKISALKDAVKNIAQTVKDFLGFSEPKEGPLSNFHTYAPDMMDLFTKGIYSSLPALQTAVNTAAGTASNAFDTDAVVSAINGTKPQINIVFEGELAALGRQLYPHIEYEKNRIGGSLVNG